MTQERIDYLREELRLGRIDLSEIAEIENAFSAIPDSDLSDLRENATAADMLDEIESSLHVCDDECRSNGCSNRF